MDSFRLSKKGEFYRIFINGHLHLAVRKSDVIAVQSWIATGTTDCPYTIEFYLKSGNIKLEYDTEEKWKEILTLVDKMILTLK